jgi:hypothetical protein
MSLYMVDDKWSYYSCKGTRNKQAPRENVLCNEEDKFAQPMQLRKMTPDYVLLIKMFEFVFCIIPLISHFDNFQRPN